MLRAVVTRAFSSVKAEMVVKVCLRLQREKVVTERRYTWFIAGAEVTDRRTGFVFVFFFFEVVLIYLGHFKSNFSMLESFLRRTSSTHPRFARFKYVTMFSLIICSVAVMK